MAVIIKKGISKILGYRGIREDFFIRNYTARQILENII